MPGPMDSITIASAYGGGSVSMAVGASKAGPFKVESFTWSPRVAGESVPKLQATGRHPGQFDPQELVLDLEGRLVGSTPTDYWTQRLALLKAIVPPQNRSRTIYEHGTITITPPGQAAVYVLVNLSEYDFPVGVLGRTSEYRFSWVAPFGYWRKVSDDSVVIL